MTKSNRLYSAMQGKKSLPLAIPLFIVTCLVLASTPALAILPHADMTGPFATLVEVNAKCVGCHQTQAADLRKSVHWTWSRSRSRKIGDKTTLSKKMADLSRFGIAAAVNPEACRRCHISIPATMQINTSGATADINCLTCHDTTGTYRIDGQGTDLEKIARTVGKPSARNCRTCHDQQCGLVPETAQQPSRDVHIERYGFSCQQCHSSGDNSHDFKRTMGSDTEPQEMRGCATCHSQTPHSLSRLNQHALFIACQSCHITEYGNNGPVIVSWNWLLSASNTTIYQQKNNPLIRQGIILGKDVAPLYLWDNGTDKVYTRGTKIHPEQTTVLQSPGPRTPASKIMPFTIQYGTQLYDTKYRYLISPKLSQEKPPFFDGTDWKSIITNGMNKIRLPYSGQYGFTTTASLRRLNHGVVPIDKAMGCMDCHGKMTRFNWQQLGYEMDPWTVGSKNLTPSHSNKIRPSAELPPIRETILPVAPPT